MTEQLAIDRGRTAVLIMDYQTNIVSRYSTEQGGLLQRAAAVLQGAREVRIPVIYIVVRFREGYPEVSPRNKAFSALKESGLLQEGTLEAEVHPAVAPQPGDVVVTKRRTGAFSTTDLDAVLRAKEVDTLVLFGLATSGVVLSTVRWAADMDYRLVVVGDCCGDQDEEVHRVLVEKVFPRQATVVDSPEFLQAARGIAAG